jgi:peroxiredoxin
MVCLESVTLQPGFQAPEFELPEPLTGNTIKLSNFTEGSTATVIMFICNHWYV